MVLINIALVYNIKKIAPSLENEEAEKYAEFDSIETIKGIEVGIKANNHKTILIEADEDAYERLKELKKKEAIDLVFNIAECLKGEARESHIPAMLEMLNIPYTGSGPLALAITLDKARTKEILSHHNIPNAEFQVFNSEKDELKEGLEFPLIVKPVAEGSSKGIKNDSLVKNDFELKRKVKEMIEKYKQPAIVEEFLEGREFTVGVIGNGNDARVLPIIEIRFDYLPKHINKFDSYEVKWIYDNPDNPIDPLVCPAKITEELKNNIKDICLRTCRVLGIKDWCRIDLRLDKNNNPYVIEINALPGIIPDPKENSRLPRAAHAAGIGYNELISLVINAAIKRYNLKNKGKIKNKNEY